MFRCYKYDRQLQNIWKNPDLKLMLIIRFVYSTQNRTPLHFSTSVSLRSGSQGFRGKSWPQAYPLRSQTSLFICHCRNVLFVQGFLLWPDWWGCYGLSPSSCPRQSLYGSPRKDTVRENFCCLDLLVQLLPSLQSSSVFCCCCCFFFFIYSQRFAFFLLLES